MASVLVVFGGVLMAEHRCHVPACDVAVAPEMLMCKPHWFMVPQRLRNQVWATYRRGQERDKAPSREWMAAAQAAITSVFPQETE